jgi:hypothetical protein
MEYSMRKLTVVVSALVLTGLVGGTAFAADGTAPAQAATAAVAADHAKPAAHKSVKHKAKTHHKKASGASSQQAPASGTH